MSGSGARCQLPRAFQRALCRPARRHCLTWARASTSTACRLAGVGSSVPKTVLTNDDLESIVETNDDWIASRTGIRRRHVLADGECITDHAVASAKLALEMAGVSGQDVDMVLLATSSPDDVFGSATQVRTQLCLAQQCLLR